MKKMMTTLSFILAVALALGPWAATLAEARGGGGHLGQYRRGSVENTHPVARSSSTCQHRT